MGQPVAVHLRVVMNTVGARDGVVQIGIALPGKEEKLLVDRHDMAWRSIPGIGVDSVMFETFHGGNDTSWAPQKDCAARFGALGVKTGP